LDDVLPVSEVDGNDTGGENTEDGDEDDDVATDEGSQVGTVDECDE
jgi:hypothetical protein